LVLDSTAVCNVM